MPICLVFTWIKYAFCKKKKKTKKKKREGKKEEKIFPFEKRLSISSTQSKRFSKLARTLCVCVCVYSRRRSIAGYQSQNSVWRHKTAGNAQRPGLGQPIIGAFICRTLTLRYQLLRTPSEIRPASPQARDFTRRTKISSSRSLKAQYWKRAQLASERSLTVSCCSVANQDVSAKASNHM